MGTTTWTYDAELQELMELIQWVNPNAYQNFKLNLESVTQKLYIDTAEKAYLTQDNHEFSFSILDPEVCPAFMERLKEKHLKGRYFLASNWGAYALVLFVTDDAGRIRYRRAIIGGDDVNDIHETFSSHYSSAEAFWQKRNDRKSQAQTVSGRKSS